MSRPAGVLKYSHKTFSQNERNLRDTWIAVKYSLLENGVRRLLFVHLPSAWKDVFDGIPEFFWLSLVVLSAFIKISIKV